MRVISPTNPATGRSAGTSLLRRTAVIGLLLGACPVGVSLAAPAAQAVEAGNTPPTITITAPASGDVVSIGQYVRYKFEVTDREDGTIDCAPNSPARRAKMNLWIRNNGQDRKLATHPGCSGVALIWNSDNKPGNIVVFDAEYTDTGGAVTHQKRLVRLKRDEQTEHCKNTAGGQQGDAASTKGDKASGT